MLSFPRSAGLLVLLGGISAEVTHAAEIPYSILHSFEVAERSPAAGLVSDGRGNLYGTTAGGGLLDAGTVFTVRSDGTSFRRLHDFVGGGSDGLNPQASLILDGFGALYGTTAGGVGTVFTMKVDGGGFQVLHSFAGGASDGAIPEAPLILDSLGTLYGTTVSGGASYAGTVFRLRTDGTGFAVLRSFGGDTSDEGSPQGSLLLDGSGNLYGTTIAYVATLPNPPQLLQGRLGTIFRIKTDGTGFQLLRTFPSSASGASFPFGSLISDASGKLYGLTAFGDPSSCGTVFSIGMDGSGFQTLHTFTGDSSDGCDPVGSLVLDRLGNVYGMTEGSDYFGVGLQVIFKVRTDASGYQILHAFVDKSDGITPEGSLILDGSDTLFGVTFGGGSSNAGTVFSIKTDGSLFQVVHAFAGMSGDGKNPYGSALISDRSGFLYGTTISGGVEDEGTVFRIRSDGTGFGVLHAFGGDSNDGFAPRASLILDGAGNLYGTTSQGRAFDGGTVFKVRTDGTEFKVLHTFLGGAGDGFAPSAALILDGASNLYGTTPQGGANGAGTVFRMKTDGTDFQLLHTFAPRTDGGASNNPWF